LNPVSGFAFSINKGTEMIVPFMVSLTTKHSAITAFQNFISLLAFTALALLMVCGAASTAGAQSQFTVVSAASYNTTAVSADTIVAGFGSGLASTTATASALPLPTTLGNVSVKVRDSQSVERDAALFFVSPTQINFRIPTRTALGLTTIRVFSGANLVASGTVQVASVAPGIFTADASGRGLAAANQLRLRPDSSQIWDVIGRYDTQLNQFVAQPIDLNFGADQLFLILYGTGLRGMSNQSNVRVTINGINAEVTFAGAQGSNEGLDQINARIPAACGNGEVDVIVTVDGQVANTVRVAVRAATSGIGTVYLATLRPEGSAQSPASGFSTLVLAADEKSAVVKFNYANLTTPETSAHIHGPADPGQNGAILFDLDTSPKQSDGSYIWTFANVGATTVSQIVQALKSGRLYINIHSARFPSGEIRGHYGFINGSQAFTPPPAPPPLPGGPITDRDAARFLTQATFGPTAAEITAMKSKGYDAWLNEQFNLPLQSVSHVKYLENFEATGVKFYQEPIMESFWNQAVKGNDQLRQRVAFALAQILVISLNSNIDNEPYAVTSYADMLNKNAFGNFRQLLEEVTLHPAMGRYLDHLQNDKEDPVTGQNPNENYAREILQLFSIGLYKLHPDGSLILDNNGLPIPTYDQNVVKGFAHVFTGWSYGTFATTENNWKWPPIWQNGHQFWLVPMQVWPNHHSALSKQLLDATTLPAGQTAQKDLKDALDNIFNHPNVGPFIARQLIQRLVTSNPSPGYVYRVTQKFNNNGSGVRGDLKAVIKAILTDYEARSLDVVANQGYGKMREPVIRMAHLLRSMNYSCTCGTIPLYWMDSPEHALGQNPWRSPTVFNFYEPGYSHPGHIASAGLVAPEFQITNDSSVIGISDFFRYVIADGFKWDDTKPLLPDYSSMHALSANPTQLIEHLDLVLAAGGLSSSFKTTLITEVTRVSPRNPKDRIAEAVHQIMTSPEYVIQK
jgi:uncharacterized protein (TIGR03437 family)